MNIIKGFYQLAKFRIKKEPIILLYLAVAFVFITAAITVAIKEGISIGWFGNNNKYDLVEIILALISLLFTTIGKKRTEYLNITYRTELNRIRIKYGIKTK